MPAVKNHLDKEFYDIPLFGEVKPDPNQSALGDYDLGEIITNTRNSFEKTMHVRAVDNGLIGVGIYANDFLTIRLDEEVNDDDIAVVKIGSKIYIRKIYFDKKLIRLETKNATPSPLIIDPNLPEFEIIGKVITVIREL